MGCATSLVKYIVFIFNFLFVLAAIAFIVIGVLVKLDLNDVTEVFEGMGIPFDVAPILMIVVGAVVFVIAFFGCCGAIKESTCMLTTYAVVLLVLLIAQIGIGVYAFIQNKDSNFTEVQVKDNFMKAIKKYNENEAIKESVDAIQQAYECCGAGSSSDWPSIPPSCCEGKPADCNGSKAYTQGCANPFYNFLKKSFKVIGIVIITIAAVELVGAIVALCLSSSIRNNERRGHYA